MDLKEAIKIIKIAIAEVEWNYPMDYQIAFETAIESLEKQVPKKPINISWTHYHCPVCRKSVNSNYCGNCGQAIDWSEVE